MDQFEIGRTVADELVLGDMHVSTPLKSKRFALCGRGGEIGGLLNAVRYELQLSDRPGME